MCSPRANAPAALIRPSIVNSSPGSLVAGCQSVSGLRCVLGTLADGRQHAPKVNRIGCRSTAIGWTELFGRLLEAVGASCRGVIAGESQRVREESDDRDAEASADPGAAQFRQTIAIRAC